MIGYILTSFMIGVLSWVMVLPTDTIKSRIQADDPLHPKYKGMVHCFTKSYKQDGPSIFVKGFWPSALRAFPVNVVIFVSYEKILYVLNHLFS